MKKLILIFLIIFTIITTGCWDMKEINRRIYPYSVGFDLNEDRASRDIYDVSITYPNIRAMGKDPTSEDTSFVISVVAKNIFDATHKLTVRNSEPIDLKHLKVLAISEEVSKDKKNLKGIIDGIDRDFKINKMVELLLAEDSAKKFLEVKRDSKRQETSEGSIYRLLRNEQESTRFTPKSLSEFIEDMDYCKSAHMPIGKVSGEEIIISGAAVFKDYNFVGKLNGNENKYLSILVGDIKNDSLEAEYNGEDLSLEVTRIKSSRKLIESKDKIRVRFSIIIRCQIHEYTMSDGKEIDSEKVFEEMGKTMEKKLEHNIKKVLDKIQKDFNTDIIGVYKHLHRFHPKIWNKVKDDWDNVFPEIEIDLDIDVNIRRRGLTT